MIEERTQNPANETIAARSFENIISLKYGPDLVDELASFAQQGIIFEAVLIDATKYGFLFTTEELLDSIRLTKRIVESHSALVFVTTEKAVSIQGDSLLGNPTVRLFENHSELFDYFPALVRPIRQLLGQSLDYKEESTDMASEVLMSIVPVLTSKGIRMKGEIDHHSRRNVLLAAIDNFTSINTINERFSEQGRMSSDELLKELKSLEADKAIFPVFAKVPMLVNCLRNRTPITLPDYMVESHLVSQNELEQLLLEMRSNPNQEPITLGPLALKKGLINSRQLEVMLQDQAFYGHDVEKEQFNTLKSSSEEAQVQSLLGHLSSVDPSNLLQNLSQNRENGVLSVECKDLQFRALFETGKLTHAKVSKIFGDEAVIEFTSNWRDGTFVFMKRTPPVDLAKDACKITKLLDKLLLDAALAKDKMDAELRILTKGMESILEKQDDLQGLFQTREFEDPYDKVKLSEDNVSLMERLWLALDGLSTLGAVIKRMGDVPAYKGTRAAVVLLHHQLVTLPQFDLHTPLEKFNQMVRKVAEKLGVQRTSAFVRLGMRDSVGFSVKARMFIMGSAGEVGINMAAAREAGTSLSATIKDIENWQIKFIEYVGQELGSDTLVSIIEEIHQPGAEDEVDRQPEQKN